MNQSIARKHSAGSNPVPIRTRCAAGMTARIVAIAVVLILSFLDHVFGAEHQSVPAPMWSKVNHDSKPTKDIGKCYFTSFGIKHQIRSCELRLLGPDIIDLVIENRSLVRIPVCGERLRGRIANGMFRCTYSLNCKIPRPTRILTCTTIRQELTLDKKTYRKGDVVTGMIDFECLGECPECQDKPKLVIVKGVFKTILK